MMYMRVATIYYSKTGRTRAVAMRIKKKLEESGVVVDTYELRLDREYSRRLLHFNPRLIYDTLSGRAVEFSGIRGFNPGAYDVVVIGSPIWFGTVAPAIKTFIRKFKGKIRKPVACFTTANIRSDYSLKFKRVMESMGYRVFLHETITDPDADNELISRFAEGVLMALKAAEKSVLSQTTPYSQRDQRPSQHTNQE